MRNKGVWALYYNIIFLINSYRKIVNRGESTPSFPLEQHSKELKKDHSLGISKT